MERDNSVSRSITSMRQKFFSRCILLYGIFCLSYPVQAADNPTLQDKRASLAKNFVSRLKDKLSIPTHTSPANSLSSNDLALSQIKEGETLLFRPRSEGYTIDYNIYAIKQSSDFYFLLSDFMEGLNFPVIVDNEQKKATGWYLREDWPFILDIKQGIVQAQGREFPLSSEDYRIEADGIYVAGHSIEAWLGIKLTYDPAQQYLLIDSPYPLPAVAQLKRRDRVGYKNADNIAQLPRQEFGYDVLNMGVADLSLRTNYNRDGQSKRTSNFNQADLVVNGELLGHTALLGVGADDTEGINTVTARLYKQSDRAELLGPLKARSYAFGDTGTVDVPLTGFSSQELGSRVSSNPLSAINYQDTRISGNAMPGWDVELYRGDALIDTQTVDPTGRYEFNNVQLYAGDNQFDVYFYGYQGEVKKESINIPLTVEILQAQGDTYDVSATMNERSFYRREKSLDVDEGTPRLAGKYNFFVGNALAYAGLHVQQEQGEQKSYLGAGTTNIWKGFVFDTNFAADEQGEAAARFGIRKNINDWNMAFATKLQTDQFSAGTDTDNPSVFQTQASVQKNYRPLIGTSGSISLDSQYEEYADGATNKTGGFGVGQGFERVSFSNSLSYNEFTPAFGQSEDRLYNDLTARMRLTNDLTFRGGATYRIRPHSRMDRYFASLNYRPNNKFNLDTEIEYEPDTRMAEAELRANYTHDRFRLSPYVRTNSDRDFVTGVNLSTSLLNVPDSSPLITSDRLIGQGSLSAFVFLDVNGTGIFDEGDEPLQEVVVESLNSRSREATGEDGYALLKRLPVTIPTDIHVDNTTLPDPFMISVNKGRSILPREGRIFEMQFPVQFSGEVDGTTFITDLSGSRQAMRSVSVSLVPMDAAHNEVMTSKAAQDGFYLFSQVPPGQYFLTVSAQDAKTLKAARPKPRILTFTHEGTTIYAQDILLQKGQYDIGFDVVAAGFFPDLQNAEPEYFIQTGKEKTSGILQALYNMRMKDVVSRAVAGLQPYTRGQDDESGGLYYRVGAGGLDAAYGRCQILADQKLPCRVVVVPASSGAHPVEQASL